MQKTPVDDIIEKIVAELISKNKIDSVSQATLCSLTDIVKTYILQIGRLSRDDANLSLRPNVSIQHVLIAVNDRLSLRTLCQYLKSSDLPVVEGYSFPNSSLQNSEPLPPAKNNYDLPSIFPSIPDSHISKNSPILSVEREQDKSLSRKRLLEERRGVKKSICEVNEGHTIVWETQDLQERKKQRKEEETAQPMPSTLGCSKNPSILPPIPNYKPIAFEDSTGIKSIGMTTF